MPLSSNSSIFDKSQLGFVYATMVFILSALIFVSKLRSHPKYDSKIASPSCLTSFWSTQSLEDLSLFFLCRLLCFSQMPPSESLASFTTHHDLLPISQSWSSSVSFQVFLLLSLLQHPLSHLTLLVVGIVLSLRSPS